MRAVIAALILAATPHVAEAQDWRRPSPFETTEDAWRRQQAERLDFERRDRSGLGTYSPRLGDPQVPPPSRFDSYGTPRWDVSP